MRFPNTFMLSFVAAAAAGPLNSVNSVSALSLVPAGSVCPINNGTIFATPNGAAFEIQCGFDSAGGDLFSVKSADLAQCLTACSTTPKCVQVSLASTTCYLKSSSRSGYTRSWIQGAKLVRVAPTPSTSISQSLVASLGPEATSSTSTSSSTTLTSQQATSSVSTSLELDSASSTSMPTSIAYDNFTRPGSTSSTSTSTSSRIRPTTSSSVSPAPACATQPVQNPSFENGSNSWTTSGGEAFSISNDACNAYSGQNALVVNVSYANFQAVLGSGQLEVRQSITVCPFQAYTVQGAFKVTQLRNMNSCFVTMCAVWPDDVGGYCSDGTELTSNYTQVTGTFPARTDANDLTNALISLRFSCLMHDPMSSGGASAVIYADDIAMINQAYPDAASVPTPNPLPSACSKATATPTSTPSSNCPVCQTCQTCPVAQPCPTCPSLPASLHKDVQKLNDYLASAQTFAQTMVQASQGRGTGVQQDIDELRSSENANNRDMYENIIAVKQETLGAYQVELSDLSILLSLLQQAVSAGQGVLNEV